MRMSKHTKVSLLIKAYLSLNKGKKVRAKDIAEWITANNFGLNNTSVKAQLITKLVKTANVTGDRMLGEVHIEKDKGVNRLWLE